MRDECRNEPRTCASRLDQRGAVLITSARRGHSTVYWSRAMLSLETSQATLRETGLRRGARGSRISRSRWGKAGRESSLSSPIVVANAIRHLNHRNGCFGGTCLRRQGVVCSLVTDPSVTYKFVMQLDPRARAWLPRELRRDESGDRASRWNELGNSSDCHCTFVTVIATITEQKLIFEENRLILFYLPLVCKLK